MVPFYHEIYGEGEQGARKQGQGQYLDSSRPARPENSRSGTELADQGEQTFGSRGGLRGYDLRSRAAETQAFRRRAGEKDLVLERSGSVEKGKFLVLVPQDEFGLPAPQNQPFSGSQGSAEPERAPGRVRKPPALERDALRAGIPKFDPFAFGIRARGIRQPFADLDHIKTLNLSANRRCSL